MDHSSIPYGVSSSAFEVAIMQKAKSRDSSISLRPPSTKGQPAEPGGEGDRGFHHLGGALALGKGQDLVIEVRVSPFS